ncbi:DUF421 domain-containing protein [Aequorivita lipolytica]|uniref:DUF421 domain-containing protein n=1 Tax=Aequorivita lipolytica TaxID=153267 RepID=A0A5C6YL91_9FLAO|nr:YetF domain-containing protein [Aequorivita lipolytica]TXD68290.1 DUF421 domain-containing protein [Aequorivita lipolytica]SRX53440.1 hypothetical protein AEQU2_02671 [Aequorivita lipolytica]
MEKWFTSTPESLLAIALSTLGIYISVIVFTRIFGKRSLSKMSSFDFAMTVAVGSLIATTALSHSVSLMDGIVGMFMVYLFQLGAAYFRRWKIFRKAIDNSPLLLMSGSEILEDNLRKARLSKGDLRSKLRQANVLDLSEVRAVVFETTGDIVVLHSTHSEKKLADWLIEDVDIS